MPAFLTEAWEKQVEGVVGRSFRSVRRLGVLGQTVSGEAAWPKTRRAEPPTLNGLGASTNAGFGRADRPKPRDPVRIAG